MDNSGGFHKAVFFAHFGHFWLLCIHFRMETLDISNKMHFSQKHFSAGRMRILVFFEKAESANAEWKRYSEYVLQYNALNLHDRGGYVCPDSRHSTAGPRASTACRDPGSLNEC